MTNYTLHDVRQGNGPLTTHPNPEGARLSALRWVATGEKIEWVGDAHARGFVKGKHRFTIRVWED